MREGDLTWLIGGPQGGGINVSAETFARAATRAGHRVFANIEYHSNIEGEHAFYRVRLSKTDRHSLLDQVNVVVALDEETLVGRRHADFTTHPGHVYELVPGGVAIYNTGINLDRSLIRRDDITLLGVPFLEILREVLKEFGRERDEARLKVMTNIVAVGASVFAIGGSLDALIEGIRADFRARAEIGEMNVRAVQLGYEHAARELHGRSPYDLKSLVAPNSGQRAGTMLMRGMHACALGKLKAGLHLQTYYPISPATDESVYLESLQRAQNLLVVQCEDEIASIQMAIGAANAGARASTSTSGPGFALMAEGIGYSSIIEAGGPVVFLWQRGGPSTGLPTREDQADLRFALHPAPGDFAHIVVAPGDLQEIFDDSFESFNWADRYQLPVVVLVDKYLSTQSHTCDGLQMENLVIDRGPRFEPNGHSNGAEPEEYLRFAFTETGVSPKAVPGQEGGIFWATSDEHNPRGHITEDATNRIRMMEKRMGKLDLAAREIPAVRKIGIYGPDDADVTLVGWGSVKGAVLDAMDVLAQEGVKVRFVQVRLMRPFPADEVAAALEGARKLVLVENNYSGQLGGLVREMTGIHLRQQILKYDGRPFSEEELAEAIRRAMATSDTRIHVSHLSA